MALRKIMIALALALALILAGCCKPDDKEGEMLRLKATINEFYEAVNRGDDDARYALFSKDALILPDGADITLLTDEIKEKWKKWIVDYDFRIKDLHHLEISLSGDIAYTVNEYNYTWHPKGHEPKWEKTKNVHIWRRQPDGSWKLRVDIWNSSERPGQGDSQ